jgi:HAD superfamily hydrolase (TIGR01509 family)
MKQCTKDAGSGSPASGMKPIAAIFDLDGLMLDTERPFVDDFSAIAKNRGWDVESNVLIQTIGIDSNGTKKILSENYGGDFPYDEIYEEFVKAQRERFDRDGIAHRPGLLTLLDYLKEKNIPRAVATSTWGERARWKLERGGIIRYFDIIVSGDEIKHGKPAPDIFLRAAEKLGKKPEECAGFEDAPAGLRALHAANIRSIFIKDLLEPPPEVLSTVWKRCESLADATVLF